MSEPDRQHESGSAAAVGDYFLPAGSGSRHLIFPGVEIRTTAGHQLMLSVVRFEPGSVVPDHSHPHEQMGMMISGRLEFTVDDTTRAHLEECRERITQVLSASVQVNEP